MTMVPGNCAQSGDRRGRGACAAALVHTAHKSYSHHTPAPASRLSHILPPRFPRSRSLSSSLSMSPSTSSPPSASLTSSLRRAYGAHDSDGSAMRPPSRPCGPEPPPPSVPDALKSAALPTPLPRSAAVSRPSGITAAPSSTARPRKGRRRSRKRAIWRSSRRQQPRSCVEPCSLIYNGCGDQCHSGSFTTHLSSLVRGSNMRVNLSRWPRAPLSPPRCFRMS